MCACVQHTCIECVCAQACALHVCECVCRACVYRHEHVRVCEHMHLEDHQRQGMRKVWSPRGPKQYVTSHWDSHARLQPWEARGGLQPHFLEFSVAPSEHLLLLFEGMVRANVH